MTLGVAGAAGLNPSAPSEVPLHSPPLDGLDANHLAADSLSLTWTGLTPGTDYNIYVLTSENFGSNVLQDVTVTAGVTVPTFTQDTSAIGNGLIVNTGLANAGKTLEADALMVQANADGEIQIVVTDSSAGGSGNALLSGAAIQEVGPSIRGFTVTQSGGSTIVTEAGSTDSFDVTLSSPPTGNVVIDVSSGDLGEATVTPATLTFDSTNWNVAQSVTVTGQDDPLGDGDQTSNIMLSIDPTLTTDDTFDPVGDRLVPVLTQDDETMPLIGIDIVGGSSTPNNWTVFNSVFSTSVTDLIGEDGVATNVDVATTFTGNSGGGRSLSPTPSSIPQHTQSLAGIDGVGSASIGEVYTATFSDLVPNAEYRVYVFGISDDFINELSNEVTLTGLNTVSFTQTLDNSDLYINGSVGSSSQDLSSYAELIVANASGEITISVSATAGVDQFGLAGLALQSTGNVGDILTVSIDSDSIIENGGTSSATVTRSTGTVGNLEVSLSSDDVGEATVPPTVTIPDGSDSVTFTITGVDDSIVDGTQPVEITAAAVGFISGGDTIDVTDDEVAPPSLVGVDFDNDAIRPASWNTVGNQTLVSNLIDEAGNDSGFDLAISPNLNPGSANVVNTSTLPTHGQLLNNIEGQGWTSAASVTLTWSDLTAGSNYEIYVFGLDTFYPNIIQNVSITGAGAPIAFDQSFVNGNLAVNDEIGSNTRSLDSFAEIVEANAFGEIVIQVSRVTNDISLGGLAIREVPPPPDPLSVSIGNGTISEADGASATTVTITRGTDTTDAMDLVLTSSDPSEATIQTTATIPAGQTSVTVNLDAVDDTAADGTQNVTITAAVDGGIADGTAGIDTTFGTSGQVTTQLATASQFSPAAIEIQPDGKILVTSQGFNPNQIFLERLNADGSSDAGFGAAGLVVMTVADGATPNSIAVQEDGKIVVGGETSVNGTSPFLARFNADGTVDTSYGSGGLVDLSSIGPSAILDIDLTSDGKVLAAVENFGAAQMKVIRVHSSGALDQTFGAGGLKTFWEYSVSSSTIKVLPNDQFLLVGNTNDWSTIVRAFPDGTLDTSFGTLGSQRIVFDNDSGPIFSMDVDDDGRIALGGSAFSSGTTFSDFAVALLTPEGNFDTTFGGDGIVVVDLPPSENDTVESVRFQLDGKIVAIGVNDTFTLPNQIALMRFNANGTLDNSFDGDGILTFSAGTNLEQRPFGSVVGADGDLLILAGGGADVRVARVNTGLAPLVASDSVSVTDNDGAATLDFGDAPNATQSGFASTYPVTLADNGARHSVGGPVLGSISEAEIGGVNSADALFDDGNGSDDEDGIAFLSPIFASSIGTGIGMVEVELSNANPGGNQLDAWVDFNRDGDWSDPGEQIFSDFSLGTADGIQTLSFSVPQDTGANVENGFTYARFRLSTVGGLAVTGAATDGEVEDHRIAIVTADPIIVDSLADEIDGDFSASDLSLREAIDLANLRPGADEIQFAPALTGGTISLAIEQLVVVDDLTITGLGASNLTISGENQFRILTLDSGNSLVINGLTLTAGQTAGNGVLSQGGAIRSLGNLELQNTVVNGNQTLGLGADGGAIRQFGGSLTLIDSEVSNNSISGDNSFGAGIMSDGAPVTVIRSTIDSNISNSNGSIGGGLVVLGADADIQASTISNNQNMVAGVVGGGLIVSGGNLTLDGSTISGNTTDGAGGGILFGANPETATITNSTISGNQSTSGTGGGISIFQGTVNIRHSTITGNTAPAGNGSGVSGNHDGASAVSNINVLSSIIADNTNSDVDNVGGGTNTFTSLGFNLIGSGNATASFQLGSDQTGESAGLGTLADNGGLTQTHALLAGSLAIDGGDTSSTETNDQRGIGFARFVGGNVDVGAFELQATNPSVTLSLDNANIPEAAGVATFTATLSEISGEDVTVNLGFTGTATFTDDYIRSGTSIIVPAGQLSANASVTAVQDVLDDEAETVIVDILSVIGGSEDGIQEQTVTIDDDDAGVPTLALAATDATKNEGDSGATVFTFTVTRTGDTTSSVTADWTVNGSGTNPAIAADFTGNALPSGTVSFAAGETAKPISVSVQAETLVEPDEGFTVALSNPSGNGHIATGTADGLIVNDDVPTLIVEINASEVGEGDGAAATTVTITRNTDPTEPLSVSLSSDDTSELTVPNSVIIPANEFSVTVDVAAVDDAILDGDQVVTVTAEAAPSLTLDGAFSGDGIQTTFEVDGGSISGARPRHVVQQDGSVAVAYNYSNLSRVYVRRYLNNGDLDSAFGTNGRVQFNSPVIGAGIQISDMIQQPDGKLVVLALLNHPINGQDFFLARLNTDGSADTSFGAGGTVAYSQNSNINPESLMEQGGKLVVFGARSTSPAIFRFNGDGTFDTTFGSFGTRTLNVPSNGIVAAHVEQVDGSILVTGTSGLGTASRQPFVARITADGDVDSSFGVGGVAEIDLVSNSSYAHDLVITPGQDIVVAGTFQGSTSRDAFLARLSNDGMIDSTFGSNGIVATGDASLDDDGNLVEVDAAGTLYLGMTTSGPNDLLRAFASDGSPLVDSGTIVAGSNLTGFGDLSLQADGKVVFSNNGVDLYRFLPINATTYLPGSDTVVVTDDEVLAETNVGLDGSGNLLIQDINGGTSDDTLTISINGSNIRVHDPNHTLAALSGAIAVDANTADVPIASITGTGGIIVDTLGGDDTLTIDFGGGNFSHAITFSGGSQNSSPNGDTLILTGGGTFADATFDYASENDGSIDITGNATITYTGLEPITSNITATNVTLIYGASAETITVSNAFGGQTTVDSDVAGETTTFNDPSGTLTINGGDTGLNTIDVGALASNYPASINLVGGDGGDTVNINGLVRLAADKSLAVNAHTINTPNSASDIFTTGIGSVTLSATRNILMSPGSSISTVDGGISLTANAGATSSGDFSGISLSGTILSTSGIGAISLDGVGGSTNVDHGILVSGSIIRSTNPSTGAGAITLTGHGATTAAAGVFVTGNNTEITSDGGDIQLAGTSSSSVAVSIRNSATVDSLGNGVDAAKIAISGTSPLSTGIEIGGSGTVSSVDGDINIVGVGGTYGILFADGGIVASTGTTVDAATITISGTVGTVGAGVGLRMTAFPGPTAPPINQITSIAGAVTVIGDGSAGEEGIHLNEGSVIQTGSGLLSVVGTGDTGAGVRLSDSASSIGSLLSTGIGDIVVTSNAGEILMAEGSVIGGPEAAGNITLISDQMGLNGDRIQSSGALTVKPNTPATSIGLGGAIGQLSLLDGELNTFQDGFSSITIGDTANGTGVVDIETVTVTDPLTIAGGTINDHSGVDISAPSVTMVGNVAPGRSPGILSVVGDFAFATDDTYTVEIGGTSPGNTATDHDQIEVTGTVAIGANVTLSTTVFNGFTPTGGETFVIIENDEADAVSGTFVGLAEGATITNFLGSSHSATITYVGGSGNDVVINVEAPPATADLSVTTQGSEAGPVAIVYTVTLDNVNNTGAAITFDFDDLGTGSATSGSDYSAIDSNAQISVDPGSSIGTFVVPVTNDALLETTETVIAQISNSSNVAVTIGAASAIANIADNDSAALTIDDVSAIEGGGLLFTVSLDNAVQGAFDVNVSFADGTAVGGTDFDNSAVTLNFAGNAGETQQFTVGTTDDAVLEGTESFVVNLDASNALVTDSDTGIGTITDNDGASVTVEDVTAVEGGGLLFTVSLDNAVQGAFDVNVSFADGTAVGGTDFDNSAVTLNFAGNAGETQQFTVGTTDDSVLEGTESFVVNLDASNALVTDSDTGIGTITDNDSAAVTIDDVTAIEGGGLLFTVSLDNAVQGAFNVNVSFTDGTAVGGTDFDNSAVTLSFAGNAGETQQFTVGTTDDAVPEGTESFVVNLDSSNALVTDSDTGIGTITDNDGASVTVEDVTAIEGGGLLFTVSLDNAVQGAFDVNVSFADGTATGGVDFDNSAVTLNWV